MQRSSGASGCNKERKTSRVTKLFQLILRRFKLGKKSRNQKSSNHDDSSDNDEDIEKISTNIFRSKLCKGPNGTYAEEDFAEAFRYFDTNGDGKITHSELQRVLKKLEINITKQEVKKMINELDKDGNGTIEYTEFAQMMTMPASRESDEYELREAFKCMDLDGNGFISKEELKEMVQKTMQKEIDETEIDEMMDEADLDGDGLIDFDEFVRILVEKRN